MMARASPFGQHFSLDGQSGRVLELCLHDRGHSIPSEWVWLDWLAKLPKGS